MTWGFAVGRACGCAGEDEGGFVFGFSDGFEEVVGGCYVLLEVDFWVGGAYFYFWVCC